MRSKKTKREREFTQKNLDLAVELIKEFMDKPQKLEQLPEGAPVVPMPADVDREHRAFNLGLARMAVEKQGAVVLAIQRKAGKAKSHRSGTASARLVPLD